MDILFKPGLNLPSHEDDLSQDKHCRKSMDNIPYLYPVDWATVSSRRLQLEAKLLEVF